MPECESCGVVLIAHEDYISRMRDGDSKMGFEGFVLVSGALLLAASGLILWDVASRQQRFEATRDSRVVAARQLPSVAPPLSSSSRWIRHPILSEPQAAQMDNPVKFDLDPAGTLVGPPLLGRSRRYGP